MAGRDPSIDLFSLPPTDHSIAGMRYVQISPTSSSLTPVQIFVERQADYIALDRSFFEWDLRFQTTTPGNIVSGENESNDGGMTSFVNNMPHSMIRQFGMKCNGTLLTENLDTYHYRAMLENMLNHTRSDGETILTATNGNWRNEIDNPVTYTANNLTGPAADGSGAHNDYKALSQNHKDAIQTQKTETREVWSGGKRKVVRMVPYHEMFHQGKMIAPNTSFEFQFWLNNTSIWTNNVTNTPVREPTSEDCKVTFYMCLVKLNPGIYNDLMLKLEKETAKYPIVKTELREYHLDNGASFKKILNPFSNRVPLRFTIAIVEQTAFNGDVTKEPFAFQKAGIKSITQLVNGEEYPYERMDLNADNDQKDDTIYQRFLEATGCLERREGNMIRKKDWGQGKNATLFVFSNVASGRHDAHLLHAKPEAHIDLHITCATQTSAKTILIMSEYESVVTILSPKSVTLMN